MSIASRLIRFALLECWALGRVGLDLRGAGKDELPASKPSSCWLKEA